MRNRILKARNMIDQAFKIINYLEDNNKPLNQYYFVCSNESYVEAIDYLHIHFSRQQSTTLNRMLFTNNETDFGVIRLRKLR